MPYVTADTKDKYKSYQELPLIPKSMPRFARIAGHFHHPANMLGFKELLVCAFLLIVGKCRILSSDTNLIIHF